MSWSVLRGCCIIPYFVYNGYFAAAPLCKHFTYHLRSAYYLCFIASGAFPLPVPQQKQPQGRSASRPLYRHLPLGIPACSPEPGTDFGTASALDPAMDNEQSTAAHTDSYIHIFHCDTWIVGYSKWNCIGRIYACAFRLRIKGRHHINHYVRITDPIFAPVNVKPIPADISGCAATPLLLNLIHIKSWFV